ncbi:unnamed protein product [Heligmosomoides polygyrus]|uniref:HTH_48 domain-containing protein n=1 Tax=Heligmosomoides polygyrus TaxID=6339 RepID=A0A183FU38_HELPZ|nr:unnamed protein product [Heligmosomoides polygyrus]
MAKQFIPTETHIRDVMLFLHQSGLNAKESYRRLKDVYNESAPVRTDPYQATRELSSTLGVSHSTVVRGLKWQGAKIGSLGTSRLDTT